MEVRIAPQTQPNPWDVCPGCGNEGLVEPSKEQLATMLHWPREEVQRASVILGVHGQLNLFETARAWLCWCAGCKHLVPGGRYEKEWNRLLDAGVARRDAPPGLRRNQRDLRLLDILWSYHNQPPEWWLTQQGYADWGDFYDKTRGRPSASAAPAPAPVESTEVVPDTVAEDVKPLWS
jgi:hypothetical protein